MHIYNVLAHITIATSYIVNVYQCILDNLILPAPVIFTGHSIVLRLHVCVLLALDTWQVGS